MLLSEPTVFFILGFVGVWLVSLSFFLYRIVTYHKRLTVGSGEKNLDGVLEKILANQKVQSEKLEVLSNRIEKIEKNSVFYLQKMGLVRFNPFSQTGGNQSFTWAILDGRKAGIIVSSLHSRENTRIYAKTVKDGKPIGPEFSKEELDAIKQASEEAKT